MAATLESFRTHFSVIVQGKSPDEDEAEDVTLLTTTQRQRTAERKASVVSRVSSDRLGAPTQQYGVILITSPVACMARLQPVTPVAPSAVNTPVATPTGTGLTSLLASLASPYTEDGKEKPAKDEKKERSTGGGGGAGGQPVSTVAGSTLFDKVR